MIRPGPLIVALVGALLLAGMLETNPDYNSAIRPFVTKVAVGEEGKTRLYSGSFPSWRTADKISFPLYNKEITRDTEGVFLIAEPQLLALTSSSFFDAVWIGKSGRRYATTKRISNLPRQAGMLYLQPGFQSRAIAIFELPPDEIAGGSLLVTPPYEPPLDGDLQLAPPDTAPVHETLIRMGE